MQQNSDRALSNRAPANGQLVSMFERMLTIRRFEERLGEDFHAGKLPGGVHLYIGQEAVAVGVCAHLDDRDRITSTHRGHGHFIAKGGDPKPMVAEIYGKRDGICGGMGGSMHVADVSRGILGANGIVAGGIPIAAGAALAAQLDGDGRVVVCFFGDGAANEGVLLESMNIAALWQLPLIFVCEHNGFSEFSPSDTVTAGKIRERARPFGLPAELVDGNDIVAVWRAADRAIDRARTGQGPSFIEAATYRIRGHLEAEAHFLSRSYRSEEEVERWRRNDPIDRLSRHLLSSEICSEAEIAAIEARIQNSVEEAAAFAERADLPDADRAPGLMFAGPAPGAA